MNLSNIAGLGAPIPHAAGPAAMVGQRPHMDYAQLPEQSMHELAVWSTAGGNGATPKPVKLTVKGADDLLHWSEPFSLKRKYGYFGPNADNTAMINAPMSIEATYSDGSTKALHPSDLECTLATPDGSTTPLTLGQELQQAWGGKRQLTISYTEDDATVSTQLAVMIGEPVTDNMKLRFKIGVEIPEAAHDDVIPPLEANRVISKASYSEFNHDLLFKVEGNVLTIEPVANCFDYNTGELEPGWLVDHNAYGVTYLLRWTTTNLGNDLIDGDESSPSYYITEVISDPDYAWLGSERPFRDGEFAGWSNLEYGLLEEAAEHHLYYEFDYRYGQYNSCVRLKGFKTPTGEIASQPEEAIGVQINSHYGSITRYRSLQFAYCNSLTAALVEHSPASRTSNLTDFRSKQYFSCTSLTEAADEDPLYQSTSIGYYYRSSQYSGCTSLTVSKPEHTFSMDGTVDAATATESGFRESQYAGCTALKPNGVEKTLEKLTGTYGAGMTRDNKYAGTGVTDVTPFYYQDNGTGDPTPALQRDTYEPADGKYIHQYTMYGGHATTGWKIEASTDSTWKSTYQAGELFTITGLTVDVYTNDGKIKSFNGSQISDSNLFRVTPQPNTIIGTGTSKVTISYQAYTSDPVVSVSLPITVTPAPPEA